MSASDPQSQAQGWLSAFEKALSSNNSAAAVAMFEADCYWRDLVSFTWNITTAEGQASVTDLLNSTLSKVKPSHWQVAQHVRRLQQLPILCRASSAIAEERAMW